MSPSSSSAIGRLATTIAVVAVLGLICIALFAGFGEPFGTLNDVCVALGGVLSGLLAWRLFPTTFVPAPRLSRLELGSNWVGAFLALFGSGLVMFDVTGWFLAGLVTTFGYALIGLWLLVTNLSALRMPAIPRRLAWFGIVAGGISACGLLAAPGILARSDDMGSAPWFVSWSLYVGGLGWNILYTIWCLWLGRLVGTNARSWNPMPEPDNLPARPVRKATFFQGLMALVVPQPFGEPLVQVDLERDLAADQASTRARTITRLRRLRRQVSQT